jgi:acetoin utilization deacetylase AcuC-like enzyme
MLRIAHDTLYHHPLPEKHRFPMEKYSLIPEQLRYEGVVAETNFFRPPPVREDIILLTHEADYWQRLKHLELTKSEIRRTGFPLSRQLVDRELVITQGTVAGAEWALGHGCALNVAGGTHHAYTDRGEGFCLLNDQAVAANYLLRTGQANRILIVDLDVHQGQGTAQIFAEEPRVFTFSMHGADNYPLHKERSDLDIPWPSGTTNGPYLDELRRVLPKLIDRHRPDVVFYLAGADILAEDKLGRLSLTMEGARERDRFVLETLYARGLPVQISMGGGYAPRVADIVTCHCQTFKLAQEIYE